MEDVIEAYMTGCIDADGADDDFEDEDSDDDESDFEDEDEDERF